MSARTYANNISSANLANKAKNNKLARDKKINGFGTEREKDFLDKQSPSTGSGQK